MRAIPMLALVALCSAFALAGCGGNKSVPLTFLADDVEITFTDDAKTFVWCGPIEPGDKRPAVHVVVSPEGERVVPIWEFHALTNRVKAGTKVPFSTNVPAAELFVAVLETEAVTGEVPGAKGTITVKKVDCDGDLEFSADGTLANEAGFNVIKVEGTFKSKVGDTVAPAFNG